MKTRKTALLVVLAMLISMLSACNNNANNNPTTDPSGTQTETETGTSTETETETETGSEPEIKVITIKEALEIAGKLADGQVTEERYYIRGKVTKMLKPQYGNMVVADETGEITVYGTYSEDGALSYEQMTDKAFVGDEVLLHCTLQNFGGTPEVKNARLIEFKKAEVSYDESKYPDMSIADIRKAKDGTLAKVDGVVAAITYANGKVPSGVMLVDGTSSIYVYDTNIAGQVKVGNTITVLGSKTNWILADEQTNAQKFGYEGCCQLESAVLVSNDNKESEFDKSWIKESTVKEIMDNPKNNNITTLIYKVNALVTKADGKGFVNYYFNDLDGKTGSYVYTQCNGSDFAWLDQYDGKICTVYLMAINAKSTSTACIYRFFPVKVEDNGFKFDTNKAPEHIVKYYGVGQFASFYSGNPELELLTSVSSDLLGFKDAQLSYSSDNTKVLDFKTVDGKVIMNCYSTGSATVTVTGTYGGKTYSEKVTISVEVQNEDKHDYLNIADAIKAQVGDEITVKGIVGPSVVNKSGFYLIDETGVIAVLMDADVIATVEIGQEVILKGKRDLFDNPDKGGNAHGQTCITNCTVVTNNYGKHDYSTATFIKDFTLADFYNLDATVDKTTQVYVLKATVELIETNYYTSIKLVDGSTSVNLYCSSAGQYGFLKQFAGQEITIEIAPCNWNDKTFYAGCVLSVITENGKILNELNFQK